MIRTLFAALMLLGLSPMVVMAQDAEVQGVSRSLIVKLKPSAREGQLLSSLEQDVRRQRLAKLASSAGYTSTMPWRAMGTRVAVMRTPTTLKPEVARKLVSRLMATGEVEWAEPSVKQKVLAVAPNDSFYADYIDDGGQWWVKNVAGNNSQDKPLRQRGVPNVNGAWDTSVGTAGVTIAVLDTGLVPHPDLDAGRVLTGYDFVSDTQFSNDGSGRDSNPADPGDGVTYAQSLQSAYKELKCGERISTWHGLAVSGVLAANSNNSTGMAAVYWATRLLPVRVAGQCGADLEDIVDAIRWSAGLSTTNVPLNPNPAKIINISFGGDGLCGPAYQNVINEVRAVGVVVVAAAGNEHGAVSRPANCSGVIAVGALNREGFKSSYSNFGAALTVSTVGGDPGPDWSSNAGAWGGPLGDRGILTLHNSGTASPMSGGGYAYYAGTSFSSPIVAGIVALMLDVNPLLTADQIATGLQVSSRPHVQSSKMAACSWANPGRCLCTTNTCGAGIVDAAEAVRFASDRRNGGTYMPLTLVAQNIDTAEVSTALTLASQDRAPNSGVPSTPVVPSTVGSSGGGGATDTLSLLAAGALALSLALGRAAKGSSRRARREGFARR